MLTEHAETTNTDTPATVAAQGANVAPETASSKKASPKKGAGKGQTSAKGGKAKAKTTAKPKKTAPARKSAKQAKATGGSREGSKTSTVMALLERKGGATLTEVMKATGWQAHSVRGFISGTLGKRMGRTVESNKREDGERVYQLKG